MPQGGKDWAYEVPVIQLDRAMRVPRELKERLSGLSKSMVTKLSRNAVDCPVKKRRVSFLECYFCPNFLRRVRGTVYCRGNPLDSDA